jgi:hypothetical protein
MQNAPHIEKIKNLLLPENKEYFISSVYSCNDCFVFTVDPSNKNATTIIASNKNRNAMIFIVENRAINNDSNSNISMQNLGLKIFESKLLVLIWSFWRSIKHSTKMLNKTINAVNTIKQMEIFVI